MAPASTARRKSACRNFEDAAPPPLKLSPRRPAEKGYVRPPKSEQNIVPDVDV